MNKDFRIYKKIIEAENKRPIELYENIVGNNLGFLLESYDKDNSRYTFLGVNPEAIIRSQGNELIICDENGEEEIIKGNPKEALKKYYDTFNVVNSFDDLAFSGGLIGHFSYDFIRFSEKLPDLNKDEIGIEPIMLMVVKDFIEIDHKLHRISVVSIDEDNELGRLRAIEKIENLEREIKSIKVNKIEEVKLKIDGVIKQKSDSLEEYSGKVRKIKEYIKEGHIFQAVLSQRWEIKTDEKGFDLYKGLRVLNPSPYLYYLNFGGFEVIGSSPEMLVKLTGENVATCPIAGTRPRGKNAEEDNRLKEDLLKDEKERAEHLMLVDLARNDMGRISKFGSVKVTTFMEVKNYSHVMHIVSLVEGKKNGSYHPVDLVASFLPAGTLSGAPKIRAMEIIEELENTKRGLYGGATGYLDFNGNMDFAITIRTMVKKNDTVFLQAGAGIVADSKPESEYNECCNKVKGLAKLLVKEENL